MMMTTRCRHIIVVARCFVVRFVSVQFISINHWRFYAIAHILYIWPSRAEIVFIFLATRPDSVYKNKKHFIQSIYLSLPLTQWRCFNGAGENILIPYISRNWCPSLSYPYTMWHISKMFWAWRLSSIWQIQSSSCIFAKSIITTLLCNVYASDIYKKMSLSSRIHHGKLRYYF